MRNNKTIWLILPFAALSLSSCMDDVSDLYGASEYDTGVFVSNYYLGKDDYAKKTLASQDAYELSDSSFFCGLRDADMISDGTLSHSGMSTMYPELLTYNGNALSTDPADDWTPDQENDSSSYVGTSFGRTYCLATEDSDFKNGLLGKLYNGQMYCDMWYAAARLQLDGSGYATSFPKTLGGRDYVLLSLRGASDISASGANRLVTIDLTLDFYKDGTNGDYDLISVTLPNVSVWTDAGGENVSFVGFKFSDALGSSFSTAGISGFGLRYDNLQDSIYGNQETITATDTTENHFALMVYEVMFPQSSIN
jgi:hypothetical protein